MKRLNTRDISSFFTKKTNKENGPPSQASEPPASPQESEPLAPEIEILPPPLTSEQNSSPSVNLPPPDFDVINLSHDLGKRKKNEWFSS